MQLPIKIAIASQIDQAVTLFCYILGEVAVTFIKRCFIQDLILNIHSYLDLLLHGSSSSFDNHWRYQQRYHELLGQNSPCFIKSTHEFKWYKVTCRNGLEEL